VLGHLVCHLKVDYGKSGGWDWPIRFLIAVSCDFMNRSFAAPNSAAPCSDRLYTLPYRPN
jgi:hypothetical protein